MGFHPSRCQVLLMTNGNQAARGVWRAYLGLVALILGYIGIYLCRKNFGVAIEGIRRILGKQYHDRAHWFGEYPGLCFR